MTVNLVLVEGLRYQEAADVIGIPVGTLTSRLARARRIADPVGHGGTTLMNTFSDETLMAFADDELDPTTRAAVAAAMRDDPEIERRVTRHRALRARIRLAYSADIQQPVPERVVAAARGRTLKSKATVTDLATVRAASAANPGVAAHAANDVARPSGGAPSWRSAAALAASLFIGVAAGFFALRRTDPVVANDGGWVAGGELAAALSGQLGADRSSGAPVHMTLSFVSKSGDYCRVFSLTGAAAASGLACRLGDAWRIRVLAEEDPRSPAGGDAGANYRTAGSSLSPLLLGAVQSRIVGEPLDHDAEIKARELGWRPVGQALPRH